MDEKTLNEFKELEQALDNALTKIRQTLEKQTQKRNYPVEDSELKFTTLKFEPQKGHKLGDFEVAHKAGNLEDKWHNAHNILRASNATIKDRYHGKEYAFSYWLFDEDKIYRQKLKQV